MVETVLITGASTGIGYELAMVFARNGNNLVITARDKKRLDQIAKDISTTHGVGVKVIAKDLSKPTSPSEIYRSLKKDKIKVSILVNNAGFATNGHFADLPLEKELSEIQVNVTSLVELTHLFLQDMKEAGRGKILNVASTAGFQPGPLMSIYYATKAFVLSFSEGLAEEVKDKGITVSVLCPGATKTEFFERADMLGTKIGDQSSPLMMKSSDVAKIGYNGLMNGKVVNISGFFNAFLVFTVRFSPRFAVRKISKYLNSKQ
ncbi:SDR family NAD(P)-dependent oxidoreductase [Leptospira sp. GIMC2001]|uniref:SDR family NAD(P)-dependent oxidoreductase n=1 Tax=Leptospira sp. GIMC2001 TaxID=1513297 RepID=UPI0023498680|nr:SDR family oxidoreductase [Leptospira sp. GIMC2001]WCL49926.1 SDR family oxidoreductase [Leptospira sp. GIMC2001]